MLTDQIVHQPMQQTAPQEPSSATIVAAAYCEDGWEIEVEDATGIRLTYWVGGQSAAPAVGATVLFYHGSADHRLCGMEIDGHRLFDTCTT
ncbi:MAG TPA: hypothetical protein VFV93_15510 [Thermomicrobiales bacterium]|nr:hypothetical protein [Thermomicrobiales bacterium]